MHNLYDALKEYGDSNAYPFHMPGHKRQIKNFSNPFSIDITEINGFDNLHHAEGILREAQERAAELYHSEETHYLVNGSTCGILSAIFACTRQGGKILMVRNAHKAAYHAALLRELEVIYLYPEPEEVFGINGGISPKQVREILDANPEISAVMITSPTYDGVVLKVEEIGEIAHKKGLPLIVDEAHGAHFGFHPYFPTDSIRLGADLVIHSLHKTLPSLTQTALLHVNGSRVDREKLRCYLGIFQTSSPSYVFMAGMDRCIQTIGQEGERLFSAFQKRLQMFQNETKNFRHIRIAQREQLVGTSQIKDFDPSKLILSVRGCGLDGSQLDQKLRERGLEMEMAAGSYALALTSICDTEEGFKRLAEALREIDQEIEESHPEREKNQDFSKKDTVTRNRICLKISEALNSPATIIPIREAAGKISREFLYLYPPGIPLLVPGEEICEELLLWAEDYRRRGYSLQGMKDYEIGTIEIVK